MKFLDAFTAKRLPARNMEKKNFGGGDPFSFYGFLFSQGFYDLSAYMAIAYYKQCSPVFIATNIVCKEVKAIRPVVMDKHTHQHVHNHPIHDLTDLPNADVTWEEFIEQLANYYSITGNAFAIVTGRPTQRPLEIYCQPPQGVTMTYATDGFVNAYNVGIQGINLIFYRKEVNGRFRYYTSDGTKEIWHIRTFNPYTQYYTGMGMSPLAPIYYELEQQLASSMHNLSLLKRGARLSGILSFKDELSDEQYDKIREEMRLYNTGEINAGRVMIAPQESTYTETSINNKDMDFLNLKIEATNAIFNALGVPLPLVSAENMTYSNLEEANLRLYNSAVIPTAKHIYHELSNFLMWRYEDANNLILTFDVKDIPALEPIRIKAVRAKMELGILSGNELRAELGYKPIEGFNDVYVPNNLYPTATTPPFPHQRNLTLRQDIEQNEEEGYTEEEDAEQDERNRRLKEKYERILRNKTDAAGNRIYTDDEIEMLMANYVI